MKILVISLNLIKYALFWAVSSFLYTGTTNYMLWYFAALFLFMLADVFEKVLINE